MHKHICMITSDTMVLSFRCETSTDIKCSITDNTALVYIAIVQISVTVWKSTLSQWVISPSPNTTYTRRPQGVNYHRYLHVLKYLLLLLYYSTRERVMQMSRYVRKLFVCSTPFLFCIIIIINSWGHVDIHNNLLLEACAYT